MGILVTGAAGFIGSYLCHSLLARGDKVIGIDNLNDYYDVKLKRDRLKRFCEHPNFTFVQLDLADRIEILRLFQNSRFDKVVHLAAQAGVRYSQENPYAFVDSNIIGFIHILEACRDFPVKHLVYASSSSVYGNNTKVPFSESDRVDNPMSLYAATKKSNELMAYSYSHSYQIPATGLRFFTVYGPWGRPDMAYFKFAHAIMNNQPLDIYYESHLSRDFTYIDDIVKGVVDVLDKAPTESSDNSYHALYNIGNNASINLTDFIHILESALDKKAIFNMPPIPMNEVKQTYADIELLRNIFGYAPNITINAGLERFAYWFKQYYHFNHNYFFDNLRFQHIAQY